MRKTHEEAKVSVIIPAFNAEKTIERTIESVLSQTYSNIEVVVVNDGSSDNTAGSVKCLCENDQRIRLINQVNQGVSVARNRGIQEAIGDFILFLDSDDVLERDCIGRALAMAALANKVDIVFWRYDLLDQAGSFLSMAKTDRSTRKIARKMRFISGTDTLKLMLRKKLWIWTGSAIYRRKMLIDNSLYYSKGCSNGEDQEFTLKSLSKARNIAALDEVLSHYTQRTGSATKAEDLRLFHTVGAYRRLKIFLEGIGGYEEARQCIENTILPERYVSVIRNLAKRGFSVSKLMMICMNPTIRSEVRKYRIDMCHPKKSLALLLFRFFPRILVNCWARLGRGI